MSDPIRLCVIGAGRHSTNNIYPSLFRLNGVRVVGNCDLDLARAKTVAQRHAIEQSYSDHRAMLEALKPDGAIICVGHDGHARLGAELLECGLHVYTEKPNATSLDQSLMVLKAQQQSGRICMVAYKKRFAPAYKKARAIIDSPEFGRALGMDVVRSCGQASVPAAALRTHLLDWTCHTLDLSTYLLGPVDRVYAKMCAGEQYAISVVLLHRSGALGHQLFTNGPAAPEERVYVTGSQRITVRVDNSIDMLAQRGDQPFAAHKPSFTTGSAFGDIEQGFAGELQEFASAIRESRPAESNISQATHTMAVFEAMWESAHGGGEVAVRYQP